MFISVERYGAQWIYDITEFPIVVFVFLMSIFGIISPLMASARQKKKDIAAGKPVQQAGTFSYNKTGFDLDFLFGGVVMAVFIASLVISSGWEFGAKLVPQVVGYGAVVVLACFMFAKVFYHKGLRKAEIRDGSGTEVEQAADESEVHFDIVVDFGDLTKETITRRAFAYFGWCFFFFGAAAVVGLLPSMFLFLVGYIRLWAKASWMTTLAIAVPLWAFCYGLFHHVLIIPWPQTVIGDMFPVLRTINSVNLF
jgi:fatty acid desaturase